jgi:hypothetical protein
MAATQELSVFAVSPRPSCRLVRRLDESDVARRPNQQGTTVGQIRTAVARALGLRPDDIALASPREILATARCLDCGSSYAPCA